MIAELLFIGLSLSAPSFLSAAESAPWPSHVRADLIPAQDSIVPGGGFTVALRLKMPDGWHTYWRNPGDSGMATSIHWELPEGFSAGVIQWPYPRRFEASRSATFGYEGEAWLLSDLHAPKGLREGAGIDVAAQVKWLECREICVPGKAELTLRLPVRRAAKPDRRFESAFGAALRRIPGRLNAGPYAGWRARASREEGIIRLKLERPAPGSEPSGEGRDSDAAFFPYDDGVIDYDRPQRSRAEGQSLILEIPQSPAPGSEKAARLSGVLVFKRRGRAVELSVPMDKRRKPS